MRRDATAKKYEIAGLAHVSDDVIYPHVFDNADREVGGVLIGRAARAGSLPMITGAIPAINADEQRATLTFTQDAWEHFHRTLDEQFPDGEQIVGWYHSHPSFGIFLSEHDLFIHRNFFSGPSQVALVVDPIGQTEGVFVWRGKDIDLLYERPTPAPWIASQAPPEARPAPEARRLTVQPDDRGPYPKPMLFSAALVGLAIGLGGWSLLSGSSAQSNGSVSVQQTKRAIPAARTQRPSHRRPTPSSKGAAADGTPSAPPANQGVGADPECAKVPLGATKVTSKGRITRHSNGLCTYVVNR
jgi:proteasome lid subunit RPN8/RPN11